MKHIIPPQYISSNQKSPEEWFQKKFDQYNKAYILFVGTSYLTIVLSALAGSVELAENNTNFDLSEENETLDFYSARIGGGIASFSWAAYNVTNYLKQAYELLKNLNKTYPEAALSEINHIITPFYCMTNCTKNWELNQAVAAQALLSLNPEQSEIVQTLMNHIEFTDEFLSKWQVSVDITERENQPHGKTSLGEALYKEMEQVSNTNVLNTKYFQANLSTIGKYITKDAPDTPASKASSQNETPDPHQDNEYKVIEMISRHNIHGETSHEQDNMERPLLNKPQRTRTQSI